MPRAVPTFRPVRLAIYNPGREYDRRARDPEAKRFYRSTSWLKVRRLKLSKDPLCERCRRRGLIVEATIVHHVRERSQCPELALDLENLESLCSPCHSSHHARS